MNLRNGVLFLKPENVDLLGGTVEDMSNINYMKELIENELYNYFELILFIVCGEK